MLQYIYKNIGQALLKKQWKNKGILFINDILNENNIVDERNARFLLTTLK